MNNLTNTYQPNHNLVYFSVKEVIEGFYDYKLRCIRKALSEFNFDLIPLEIKDLKIIALKYLKSSGPINPRLIKNLEEIIDFSENCESITRKRKKEYRSRLLSLFWQIKSQEITEKTLF